MEYIYKFSNFTEEKLESLSRNEIWFSYLNDFNDPFEGEYKCETKFENVDALISACRGYIISYNQPKTLSLFDEAIKKFNLQEITEEDVNGFISLINKGLEEHIEAAKKVAVTCLIQEKKDLDPLKNNLMWAHYADGLRGFCLKFNSEKFRHDLLLMNNNTYLASSIVCYQTEVPSINPIRYFSENFTEQFPGIQLNAKAFMYNLLSSKSLDWKYEKEIRFFSSQSGPLKYSEDALVELVIGEKMEEANQKRIIDIISSISPKTKISKAKRISGRYTVEIVDL